MNKQKTFGNPALTQKLVAKFGANKETVKTKMRYSKEVRNFVDKIESANKKTSKSELVFG